MAATTVLRGVAGHHARLEDRPTCRVLETLAITTDHVVYRNDLFGFLRYVPTAENVHPEPVLIGTA